MNQSRHASAISNGVKRILIFSTAYFPHVGGAEVAIKEITDRIGGACAFDLICARYEARLPARERIGAVDVYRVGIGIRPLDKLLAPFLGALLALALERKQPYDVYWAMMASYGSGGAYIANILRFKRPVPIVLTLQEGDPPEYIRTKWFGLVGFSWRLALSRSAAVSVISSYLGRLARTYGYRGEPILIPNGVNIAHFSAPPPPEALLRMKDSLGKKHGDTFLVTTSRLVHKNAVDDVIRALPLLSESVSFLIYGTGPDDVKLKELVRKLGVQARVRFMGQISHTEMPLALAACDIFVRPSRSEGMGNSFIEAMAAGVPVIATQEGGIVDFLFDEKRNPDKETTGWAVDTNSPEQIATAVQDIISHPDKVAKVRTTARELAESYDWNLIARDMRTLFENTCDSARTSV